jgi:hypothetical protein
VKRVLLIDGPKVGEIIDVEDDASGFDTIELERTGDAVLDFDPLDVTTAMQRHYYFGRLSMFGTDMYVGSTYGSPIAEEHWQDVASALLKPEAFELWRTTVPLPKELRPR